ncbi:MAG: ornithine--oxo-acid transaminase [Candidatus Eremiobacteraeota bacterium]|nr:ornithine--oxo-acid transaminase [Candidatus Eremiobacteraeota bacterium]
MPALEDKTRELIELEERHGAHNYHPLDLVVERAEGVWLYDVNGKRYLDCVSAYSAVNQGHCHPRILEALTAQARRVTLVSRALRSARLPRFLEKLTALCGYDMALPMNTGVEAVETAIKLSRRWGYDVKGIPQDRAEIVVFNKNFHGRTTSAISASSNAEYRRSFGPFTPGFVLVPFGDIDALRRAITPHTAAVLIEPIQGEGGVNVPPAGFLSEVRALCTQQSVLFVADEIQTGFGRTGTMFACDFERVKPDILVVGKALGGGFYPVSAALADAPIMGLFQPGDHGSTFGGNPLACAVAEASLDVVVDEDLPGNAHRMGDVLMRAVREANSPLVADVRGRGLLVGIETTISARAISDRLLERGIAAKDTHANVLRLAPPLVIDRETIDVLAATLREVLAELA